MTNTSRALLLFAAFVGCVGGLVVERLAFSEFALAQDPVQEVFDKINKKEEIEAQRRHEKDLARAGALKMQVYPVDPGRCIGFEVVVTPSNGAVRVFRVFEDGRVELFKQPSGVDQPATWGIIGQPGYTP